MANLNTSLVNIGLTPNDGTGQNIRDAFNTTNNNVIAISSYLNEGPTFTDMTVTGQLTSDSLTSAVGLFTDVVAINANVPSLSTTSGSLTVQGGIGLTGNLNVGGRINGEVYSSNVVAGALMVTGGAGIAGSLQAGEITTGNVSVTHDVTINGQLTVLGNVITTSTSEMIIKDPIIELGVNLDSNGDPYPLTTDDGKNRGVQFYYFNTPTLEQRTGYFGFRPSDDKFIFTANTASTTLGAAAFSHVEANVTSTGSSSFGTVTTSGNLTASGNVITSKGFYGNLMTAAQPNVTSVGTLSTLNTSGNINVSGGNINLTSGTVYVNGVAVSLANQAFTGGTVPLDTAFTSNSSAAVAITGGATIGGDLSVGGTITVPSFSTTSLGGTLTTAAQPNITSVGTLSSLSVTGSFSSNTASVVSLTASNTVSASTIAASTGLSGTLTTASQPNITTIGTLGSLTVTGNITATKFTGLVTGNVTGNVSGSAATVTAAAQPNITSVGSLTGLDVNGAVTVNSLDAGSGIIQTTGNVVTTTSVVGAYLYGQLKTAAQPNVTSVGNLSSLVVTGTASIGSTATFAGSINTSGSGTMNIGSSTNRFGTVYSAAMNVSGTITAGSFSGTFNGTAASIVNQANSATITAVSTNVPSTIVLRDASGDFAAGIVTATATNARYADLAEMYQSDGQYEPGTVLVFGGTREVTLTGRQADVSVAGVVSTAPAYLMNIDAPNAVPVALRGKVPVKVTGPVRKGDLLVTSYIPGYAISVGTDSSFGVAVFAKSLSEDLSTGYKIINAVII